ncbi:MAG: DUF294 nucleotidyltransferase-like domain-containing protein, partial [Bacteroidales bacterium]
KVVNETESGIKYCDGIVEDITEYHLSEIAKEKISEELQISQSLLNRPVKDYIKPPIVCDINTPIKKAAALMNVHKSDVVLVQTTKGEFAGIVTDNDLRKRVVAQGFDTDEPVFKIMSEPIIFLPENALLYEAFYMMQDNKVNHLIVKDGSGKIKNIISSSELLNIQKHTSELLIKKIGLSETPDDLIMVQLLLKQIIRNYTGSGANPQHITRIISSVSDSIIEKLNQLAIEELGQPPVSYSFITLGSVGREEQTLATDQDNAIIYEDVPDEKEREVNDYFLKLGEKICIWLDRIGYSFCKGNIMAMNPKFCKPLSVWKKYFSEWVATKEPQDLLDINIFFDFRFSYGNPDLAKNLKDHLNDTIENNNLFFYHLALNTLSVKPPVSFFGNIIKEDKENHPDSFDIKRAIMPVVGFARVYALKNGISDGNTLVRIGKLFEKNIILKSEHEMIVQMYSCLMNLRFRHQVDQLIESRIADNYINPNKLSELDQTILKKIFSQIGLLHTKLNFDFKGTMS